MITLTESAKNYLSTTTKKSGKKYAYLGVLGGGCSGCLLYTSDAADE